MFTINRDEAVRLAKTRRYPQDQAAKKLFLQEQARSLLNLESSNGYQVTEEQQPPVRWAHQLQKIDIQVDEGIHVPGLLYKRAASTRRRPALLLIDEQGKWNGFKQQGYLARAGRFINREDADYEPLIFSVDVSGLGELSPEPTAYDLASWNDVERILTYLAIGAHRPIMGLRVRDACYALEYLGNRPDVDPDRIIIAGRGVGAIVALHTALLADKVAKVILWDMLKNYAALTEVHRFVWRQSTVIPGILQYYDLPDVIEVLPPAVVTVINPVDGVCNQISEDELRANWGPLVDRVVYTVDRPHAAAVSAFVDAVHR